MHPARSNGGSRICTQPIAPSNLGSGPTGSPSRTYPHKKFHSQLETKDVDLPASALPSPDGALQSVHHSSRLEKSRIRERSPLRPATFPATERSNRATQSHLSAA